MGLEQDSREGKIAQYIVSTTGNTGPLKHMANNC